MKFEINIPEELLPIVVEKAHELHNISLHNMANTRLRNPDSKRVMDDEMTAKATMVLFDIVNVIENSIKALECGEDPADSSYGDSCCCQYVSE